MRGERLGPYRIDRELGSGGMGRVYSAVIEGECPQLEPGTRVALKVLHPHLMEHPGFFRRFLREARLGTHVRHPNVVRTHLADAIEGRHVLVMEYVEGQTLRDLLADLQRVPETLCRHVGREICKGLTAIHEAGIVHRDLKPENVLITPRHEVKVMDLGVARVRSESIRLSEAGAFTGSLCYAAPEVFVGGGSKVDGRADLHALGLVLYELASGVNPYLGDDVAQTIRRVLHEDPPRLGDVNPQLTPFFEEVVHRLLAKLPERRFASAAEMLRVLEEGESSTWWSRHVSVIRSTTDRPLRRIRIPRETAVHGREEQLGRLRTLYDAAKSGDGRVVLIEGEAGIGKSRLVDELVARLHAAGEDLNFLFGSYPPGGTAGAAGAFAAAYREHLGIAGSARYLAETPLLVPAFDAILQGESPPEGVVSLTRDALESCFVHVTRALAAERPTIVLIDDLHFAPDASRALFIAIGRAVAGHRILLLGTTRRGLPEDWIGSVTRPENAECLRVPRLGRDDLRRLLQDAFRSERLAADLAERIMRKTDGNPFFAFEIIRGLREGRFVTRREDGTWARTGAIEDIEIPSSVLDLVNARVAALSHEERDVLDMACCRGYEFDPLLLCDVFGMEQIPMMRLLARIERKHRLVRSSGRHFVFDHHLVQEALYTAIPSPSREQYHAALAKALESRSVCADGDPDALDGGVCVDICEHSLAGGLGERALRYLGAALQHLERGHLFAEVVALAERALAVPGLLEGPDRARQLLRIAGVHRALDRLGMWRRQVECAREADRIAEPGGDDALRFHTANALGSALVHTSQLAEGEAAHRRSLAIAERCGRADWLATARMAVGALMHRTGRLREAHAEHAAALAITIETADWEGQAIALGNLGTIAGLRGDLHEAREHLTRSISVASRVGNRVVAAQMRTNLAIVATLEGRYEEAAEHHRCALAETRELGHRPAESRALTGVGGSLFHLGSPSAAVPYFEQALALSVEVGDKVSAIHAEIYAAVCHAALGRFAVALTATEHALLLSREVAYPTGEALCHIERGATWSALGAWEQAQESLASALDLSRQIGQRVIEAHARHRLAELADDQGDAVRAEQVAGEALAMRRDLGQRAELCVSLLFVGDLRRRAGDIDAARRCLGEALAIAKELKLRSLLALAHARMACLARSHTLAAIAAMAELEEQPSEKDTCWALFEATGDRVHLASAKRVLDHVLRRNPPEYHESMRRNVRINREILAAWMRGPAADEATPSWGTFSPDEQRTRTPSA